MIATDTCERAWEHFAFAIAANTYERREHMLIRLVSEPPSVQS